MLLWAALGAATFFVLAAAVVLWWGRRQVRHQKTRDSRQRLLHLAAQAANDPTSKQLLILLGVLEAAGDDCPVVVDWVRRPARGEVPEGMLVTITWDGNEWRQVQELGAFRERVAALVVADPACASARARQLLADLGG